MEPVFISYEVISVIYVSEHAVCQCRRQCDEEFKVSKCEVHQVFKAGILGVCFFF